MGELGGCKVAFFRTLVFAKCPKCESVCAGIRHFSIYKRVVDKNEKSENAWIAKPNAC